MATLREVAELAEVSVATASAVLAGRALQRRIAGATAERVRAAAKQLGYRGHAAARALARGSPGAIAFAVSTTSSAVLASAFTSHTAAGVIARAYERGYGAVIAGPRPERNLDYLEVAMEGLQERRYDGVVVAGLLLRQHDVELLAAHPEAPVVAIDPRIDLAVPSVRIAWRPGIEAAVADLAQRGHRQVRYCGADMDDRVDLIGAACAARGLVFERHAERDLIAEDGSLEANARSLLAGRRPALIAYNDALALCLLRALVAAGLAVPRDCSLIGFDDVESRHCVPRLASIDHRFCDQGAAAVDLLLERLAAGPGFRAERAVPARYVRGESVA